MLYKRIASRPSAYKNMKKIPLSYIQFNNIEKKKKISIYIGICKSQSQSSNHYNFKIQIKNPPLNLNSDIKVYCNCESFTYQFQTLLFRNNGLLTEYKVSNIMMQKPKKTKPLYICKHLEAALTKLLKMP